VTGAEVYAVLDGDVVRISLVGEVDLSNADLIQAKLVDAISNRASAVVLDLAGVRYLDSAGLRVLFLLVGRLETLQIGLEVSAPIGSPARRVVELSGLAALVPLDPAVEDTAS
jgi:stage II sporulation protein AA (anti-sigma F factor antagonist)